jgi:hypothetical protein
VRGDGSCICEPEAGRNLSDDEERRDREDLIDCQEGSEAISGCNKKRSRDDLKDCHECRTKIQVARRAMR